MSPESDPESVEGEPPSGSRGERLTSRGRALLAALRRALPAARLVWILLLVLAGYGLSFLGTGIGLTSVVALPIAAVAMDLLFQRARFERPRFPDGAIATGLFLALLFPPVVPLVASVSATVGAIALRHVLRIRGRPWLNPAISGVLIGAILFGLAPAWWGSISETLVIALGVVLAIRSSGSWRLSGTFIVAYAILATFERVVFSVSTGLVVVPKVLLLSAIDPTVLFFALFMVVEPRTAPTDAGSKAVYALVVAAAAAMFPLFLPTLALPVALVAGNAVAVTFRFWSSRTLATPRGAPRARASKSSAPVARPRPRADGTWTVGRRVGAGFAVFLLIGIVAAATYSPSTSGGALLGSRPTGGGSTAVSVSHCQVDNATIASSTADSLHKSLGPSVLLSYNPATGVTVFFDPVNQVTVTETDIYEDYGFAEFNGDDYTSAGCVPP